MEIKLLVVIYFTFIITVVGQYRLLKTIHYLDNKSDTSTLDLYSNDMMVFKQRFISIDTAFNRFAGVPDTTFLIDTFYVVNNVYDFYYLKFNRCDRECCPIVQLAPFRFKKKYVQCHYYEVGNFAYFWSAPSNSITKYKGKKKFQFNGRSYKLHHFQYIHKIYNSDVISNTFFEENTLVPFKVETTYCGKNTKTIQIIKIVDW